MLSFCSAKASHNFVVKNITPVDFVTALTLLHSEQPKLCGVLAVLSAVGLRLNESLSHDFVKPMMLLTTRAWARWFIISHLIWDHVCHPVCDIYLVPVYISV